MKRIDIKEDLNTPEQYDEIYFGPRSIQLPAFIYIWDMLIELNKKKGNVLDVGCGLGRYFRAFKGSKIYGTELSTKAIEKVNNDYPEAKVVQWYAGDPLPFDDNFFNLVWAGEFLEHLEEPSQAISEIHRVLAPEGKALFITPIGKSSVCEEHLWFFDRNDINSFFERYPKKEIETLKEVERFKIVLTK